MKGLNRPSGCTRFKTIFSYEWWWNCRWFFLIATYNFQLTILFNNFALLFRRFGIATWVITIWCTPLIDNFTEIYIITTSHREITLTTTQSAHWPHLFRPLRNHHALIHPSSQMLHFCIKCGTQMVASVPRCPNAECRAFVHTRDRFCVFCGTSLQVLTE